MIGEAFDSQFVFEPWFQDMFNGCDILAIERIRDSHTHEYLRWAVGCIIGAVNPTHLLEVSPAFWKKYSHLVDGYVKSDVNDAILIGISIYEEAKKGA